jgi:CubicO group peptidase (beta-lactamase class C family)
MMIRTLADPKIGPPGHRALGIDGLELQARVREILNRHPAVGLAVGVAHNGRLEFFSGHGRADIASNTPVTKAHLQQPQLRYPRPARRRRERGAAGPLSP